MSAAAAPARVGLPGAPTPEGATGAGAAAEAGPPNAQGSSPAEGEEPAAPEASGSTATATAVDVTWPSGRARRRPARLGLSIQFESRPDDSELGRLVESTVWVNDAHPAYRRAAASRAEGYHIALTVALALATLAVEPSEGHRFVTAFLVLWGEAVDRPARRKGSRRNRAAKAERER